jgi:hypothetical protein
MGSVVCSNTIYESDGSYGRIDCDAAFSASYNNTGSDTTTGETLTAASVGLTLIMGVDTPPEAAGYGFQVLGLASGPAGSVRIKVFQGGSGTTGGTTVTGTNASSNVPGQVFSGTPATLPAQIFTGTSAGSLNLAAPAFSGTGTTAAGQVITTTDNQTMTLNQCAGMWLIQATGSTPPNLILSNTAVVGAPAVLTVQGAANTDAGTYKIVKNIAPVGTNATSSYTPAGTNAAATAAAQVWTASGPHTHTIGAGAGSEVPNATNLSVSLASVRFTIFGK